MRAEDRQKRQTTFVRSHHFPQNASINRAHFRDFEAYRSVADALARPRIGWPWACNGGPRIFLPTTAKGDRGEQKQESTYVRSVPLRGEDTTVSVPSKGVSFRVVSGASVTPVFIFFTCPLRVCLTVSTHVTRGDALDAPQCSSRPSRAALAGWVRDADANSRCDAMLDGS